MKLQNNVLFMTDLIVSLMGGICYTGSISGRKRGLWEKFKGDSSVFEIGEK